MKTLVVAIIISLLASTSFAAGTMKYKSDAEIGLMLGESLIRFSYMIGKKNLVESDKLEKYINVLVVSAYAAGENNMGVEDMIERYIVSFKKQANRTK